MSKKRSNRRQRSKKGPGTQAPEQQLPAVVGRPLSRRKKACYAAITVVAFFGLLELALFVAGVRPVLYDEDPYLGFSSQIPLLVEQTTGDGSVVMATAPNKLHVFNAQSFPRDKGAGVTRVFCVGGSTTYGRPYGDETSFCGWLRAFLPAADPSREWEVFNAGGVSYASYRVALVMEELINYSPDLFVIYTGHNEFLERRTYGNLLAQPQMVRGAGAFLSRSRTYSVMKKLVHPTGRAPDRSAEGATLLAGEVKTRLDETVGPSDYTRDEALKVNVVKHFRFNLNRMIDIARSAGAEVVLVVPASNLRDCTPFRNQHRDGLSRAKLERWKSLYDGAGRSYLAGQMTTALEELDQAADIDDRYAQLHYLRGHVLYKQGDYPAAKAAFERAIEEDVCPLRAIRPLLQCVEEIAAARVVPVVDFPALVDSRSPHGIPAENLFLDHVHPTIEGNRQLALAIIEKLIDEETVAAATWNDEAIENVTDAVTSGIDLQAHAIALLYLSKVLGWAGKVEESAKLATKAVALDPENPEALYYMAVGLQQAGQVDRAAEVYRQVIARRPEFARAHAGLGSALLALGELEAAEASVRRALELQPQGAGNLCGLGEILLRQNELHDAMAQFQAALALEPDLADARAGLGRVLFELGDAAEAARHLRMALKFRPDDGRYRRVLGDALFEQGDSPAAQEQFETALAANPNDLEVANAMAWLLATTPDDSVRNGARAVALAERVCRETGFSSSICMDTLAAAYAEAGRFDEAVSTATKATELAKSAGKEELAAKFGARREMYRAKQPYRSGQ
ncbi:tetratricopeptide repeat protein [Pirellulales bacterium]|nr:tetratricopeptide repeat protein [Pirellulales bacterium]